MGSCGAVPPDGVPSRRAAHSFEHWSKRVLSISMKSLTTLHVRPCTVEFQCERLFVYSASKTIGSTCHQSKGRAVKESKPGELSPALHVRRRRDATSGAPKDARLRTTPVTR